MQTSADDGKGKAGSFMYIDKTVFKTSPKTNIYLILIKTHDSESRGQEEAAVRDE